MRSLPRRGPSVVPFLTPLMAVAAAAAMAGASLAGCSSDESAATPARPSTTIGGTASTAVANGAEVGVEAFAAAAAQPGVVILDVRTPAEFAAGHLATAINVDVQAADFETKVGALDHAATYAVYCHSGRRSGIAVETMRRLGFTSTFHLAGGISAWIAAGKPTTTG